MRIAFVLSALALALTGCGTAYTVADPVDPTKRFAKCFENFNQSFCQVAAPEGTAVVPGMTGAAALSSVLSGSGIAAMGAGVVVMSGRVR